MRTNFIFTFAAIGITRNLNFNVFIFEELYLTDKWSGVVFVKLLSKETLVFGSLTVWTVLYFESISFYNSEYHN